MREKPQIKRKKKQANEAGEEEIVLQVHQEADAALTSQRPSIQAKECLCAFMPVCFPP